MSIPLGLRDGPVPEQPLDHAQRDAAQDEVRREAVAQIVDPHPAKSDPIERVVERLVCASGATVEAAVSAGEHQLAVARRAPAIERGERVGGERHSATPVVLGGGEPAAVERVEDVDRCPLAVDARPMQGVQFSAAEAGAQRDGEHRRPLRGGGDGREELVGFGGPQPVVFGQWDLEPVNGGGRGRAAPLSRAAEQGREHREVPVDGARREPVGAAVGDVSVEVAGGDLVEVSFAQGGQQVEPQDGLFADSITRLVDHRHPFEQPLDREVGQRRARARASVRCRQGAAQLGLVVLGAALALHGADAADPLPTDAEVGDPLAAPSLGGHLRSSVPGG